ncbi:MAG: hypothetical protein ACHQ4H_05120 [Ktedonobacterales bacterium]
MFPRFVGGRHVRMRMRVLALALVGGSLISFAAGQVAGHAALPALPSVAHVTHASGALAGALSATLTQTHHTSGGTQVAVKVAPLARPEHATHESDANHAGDHNHGRRTSPPNVQRDGGDHGGGD